MAKKDRKGGGGNEISEATGTQARRGTASWVIPRTLAFTPSERGRDPISGFEQWRT